VSTTTNGRFLDLRALAAVEHMRFATRHRIEGAYSGRHQSRQQGGAGEFVDFREYTAGEDLRRLDWKVYGRTGKAYVRLYQDETNLLCTLAIDISGSMKFAGYDAASSRGSKLEYVQYLATALSHVIHRGQDQVGLALLGETLLESVPPGGTLNHVALVRELIETIETKPSQRIAEGLRKLFEQSRQRGVLLLMSDYLIDDMEELIAAIRLFRHRGSEVILLHVIHPDEERLPEGAAFRFEGLEGEGYVDCSPAELRQQYARQFHDHAAAVRAAALATGCDYRRVSTAIPYMQTLGEFLVERVG